MPVMLPRRAGMLVLAIWLILNGAAGLATLPLLPPLVMPLLALLAGVLILVGR